MSQCGLEVEKVSQCGLAVDKVSQCGLEVVAVRIGTWSKPQCDGWLRTLCERRSADWQLGTFQMVGRRSADWQLGTFQMDGRRSAENGWTSQCGLAVGDRRISSQISNTG